MNKSISEYVNSAVKEYAISVLEERAIPSVVDGFKPVQRKIIFTADKVAKSYVKTAALVGNVISVGGYYKGDSSIAAAASMMAQDFTGSNNHPFLEGQGEFGKRLTPHGIAAARYTKCRIHPNFRRFFSDHELLEFQEQDGEYFEPKYYLPIIPTTLLNGISGIAVGFACIILPYKLSNILSNVEACLNDRPLKKMKPHWEGYKGEIKEEDGKWVMYGVWRKINTSTIEITEVPIGASRDSYVEHLIKLEDEGKIQSFDDLCKKEFRFVINIRRTDLAELEEKGKVESMFKLRKVLSENLNFISEEGKLINFEDATDVIKHFVKFRKTVLAKRKTYTVKVHEEAISFLNLKKFFIERVIAGDIDLKKIESKTDFRSKTTVVVSKINEKIADSDIERLINIPIYSFNKEETSSIKIKIKEHETKKKFFEEVSIENLYELDLQELKRK